MIDPFFTSKPKQAPPAHAIKERDEWLALPDKERWEKYHDILTKHYDQGVRMTAVEFLFIKHIQIHMNYAGQRRNRFMTKQSHKVAKKYPVYKGLSTI